MGEAALVQPPDRGSEKAWRPIIEALDQRFLEARRIVVEEGAHIGRRHRFRLVAGAERRQAQRRPEAFLRVEMRSLFIGFDSGPRAAHPLVPIAEGQPATRPLWCKRERLFQDLAGGGTVARLGECLRIGEPAVGDEIAGTVLDRRMQRHDTPRRGRAETSRRSDIPAAGKRKTALLRHDCRLALAPETGRAYGLPMRFEDVLIPTPAGLYCPPGDFHIDPTRPVPRALITHGHADHARAGHGGVLATRETLEDHGGPLRRGFCRFARGGDPWRRPARSATRRSASIRPGTCSARPRSRWRRAASASSPRATTSAALTRPACRFEPVPCDVFITEATFALPVFRHPEPQDEIDKLLKSLKQFPERAHLVGAYSLGKAQRVIRMLRESGWDRTIYLHGAMETLCRLYEEEGIALGPLGSGDRRERQEG